MNYSYDESGIHFIYFILTILGLVVLPLTWKVVRIAFSRKPWEQSICKCQPCTSKKQFLRSTHRSLLRQRKFFFMFVGWIVIAALSFHVWKHGKIEKASFDPFEILGVASGSSVKEIRKAYLLLSIKYHPDKIADEERQFAHDRFVQITKAYKCLTDPVTKANYELYGNPDGVNSNDIGIALPAWLVDSKNLVFVLGFYCLAIMAVLPYFIRKWWKSSSKYTKDNIMHLTMALFYRELKDNMSCKKIIELLSAAAEFKEDLAWKNSDTMSVPTLFNSIRPFIDEISGEKFELSKRYTAPYAVKAFCLLNAHLYRYRIPEDCDMLQDQQFVVQKSLVLLNGLIQICLARGWVSCMKNCIATSQLIVQAIPEAGHQLLQLPYVTHGEAKEFKNRKRNVKSVKEFLTLTDADRKIAMNHVTDEQFNEVVRIAHAFPSVEFSSVKPTVLGYDEIICGSVITLQVRLYLARICNASEIAELESDGVKPSTPINPAVNEFQSNFQMDEDGNVVEGEDFSSSKFIYAPPTEESFIQGKSPIFIHAPYFYSDRTPSWWIIVSDDENDFVCAPKKITNLPLQETASPSANFGRLVTFQFPAPKKPTTLRYTVTVKGDFSIGFDLMKDLKIPVVEEPKEYVQHGIGSKASGKRTKIAEYEGLTEDDEEDSFNL